MTTDVLLSARLRLPQTRRELHAFAEPGWCEFRTASKVAVDLRALGWSVQVGRQVIAEGARMGVPPREDLQLWLDRAVAAGADASVLRDLEGGFTGVVATLRGPSAGPTIALRFDLDANLGHEADECDHRPVREGFASEYPGAHHNCGHDGHTALGLALAEVLAARRDDLRGEVRLIFQPAEEGLRGAASMVAAGALDNVDYFFGCHIGVQALSLGEIIVGYDNILGSIKLDARFEGRAAHAALSPQLGRNALLAACSATLNLYAIGQHGDGETRVNVGLLQAGVSRNTVAPNAYLAAEVRGETAAVVEDLKVKAMAVLNGSAASFGVTVHVEQVGASCPASSSKAAVELVRRAAQGVAAVRQVSEVCDFKACDDVAVMMHAVQGRGGQAVYFGLGSPLPDVHHTPRFDFDEACLPIGLDVFLAAIEHAMEAHRAA